VFDILSPTIAGLPVDAGCFGAMLALDVIE
jgi:hypothetical protein